MQNAVKCETTFLLAVVLDLFSLKAYGNMNL